MSDKCGLSDIGVFTRKRGPKKGVFGGLRHGMVGGKEKSGEIQQGVGEKNDGGKCRKVRMIKERHILLPSKNIEFHLTT